MYCSTVPLRQKPVRGAYGECNSTVHELVRCLAAHGATKWMKRLPSASLNGAQGRLAWMMKRRVGMVGLREGARLLLDRLEYVGAGAMGRIYRRKEAARHRQAEFFEKARHQHDRSSQAAGGAHAHQQSTWNDDFDPD